MPGVPRMCIHFCTGLLKFKWFYHQKLPEAHFDGRFACLLSPAALTVNLCEGNAAATLSEGGTGPPDLTPHRVHTFSNLAQSDSKILVRREI